MPALLPPSVAPYAKAVVSFVLSALTAVSAIVDLPQWVTILSAVLTVAATYLVPNAAAPAANGPTVIPDYDPKHGG